MKKYNINLTLTFKRDLKSIYLYISEKLKEPANALNTYSEIRSAVFSLNKFPERYPIVDEPIFFDLGLRRLFVKNYVVFYIIRETDVIVLRVLYKRRRWQNLISLSEE